MVNGKDAVYNEEDQTLKVYLRGRPIRLPAPSTLTSEGYDPTEVQEAPSRSLRLDWVYGYRGRDCRSNLYFLPTGEMIYFVAAVVVLHNKEEQTQRHYLEHTDDIKSLAIHPNKLLVATGQCAGHNKSTAQPHIRVWDSVTLETRAVIGTDGDFFSSVCCLSFSGETDGRSVLVAVDESPDHVLSVWDYEASENGQKITETKCSMDVILSVEFDPSDGTRIVTCGKSHLGFWTLDSDSSLRKRTAVFESHERPKYVTCLAFLQPTGDVASGDSNGNLAVWGNGSNAIKKWIEGLHEGAIFALHAVEDGGVITGGGKDRLVQWLNGDLEKEGDGVEIESQYGGIRTITKTQDSQLLIGTTRNCILIGTRDTGFEPITWGHFDEIWGLSTHPSIPQFVTAGYDKLLSMWDPISHTIVWKKEIGDKAQCVTFSPDGSTIAVGCLTGTWMTFDSDTRELLCEYADGSEPIQVIQYSPEGSMIAVGSRNNYIYLYQTSDAPGCYNKIGRCTGHSSFVTHLDWSSDGQTIRSNSGDYELLYWNSSTCEQITQNDSIRDIEWATNSCTLTFTSVGIWPENADGTDVNSCNRSHDGSLMATADDFGKVNLYSFPVKQPQALNRSYGGHSSHVTNVDFLINDSQLISIGGNDTSILQWTVL